MQSRFQSYQLAYQLSYESKVHNQSSNKNTEGKYEVEMQTPVDDSGIFTEYREARKLPPSSR